MANNSLPHETRDPHDDLRELIQGVPAPDAAMRKAVEDKLAGFPGPAPALGTLGERVAWLASWQRRAQPQIARPLVAVFAATHDVAGGPVVKTGQERVVGLTQGSAAVRGIAASLGAAFKVYEFGLEHPAADITQGPSLSARDTAAAFAFGMEVVAEGADIIALGSLGVGAATAAAAIARGLYGGTAEYWAKVDDTKADTKADGEVARARVDAVSRATDANTASLSDPMQILSAFGGRDIAGFAGSIIAARYQAIPVVLDGFVTCAAAAVLHAVNPDAVAHCIAGHHSGEHGQAAVLDRMGLDALHDFGVGPGDGTGAALALATLKAACAGLETL